MKTASANLTAHIQQDTTTLSTCWRIKRVDNTVLAFTDHDVDIPYDAITYKAATGFTRSAIESSFDLSIDSLDIQGLFDSAEITESDLRAGLYNGATIYVFMINWETPADGIIKMRRGIIGEVKLKNGIYVAELQGLSQYLSNEILELYTTECQADFGDARCGFSAAALEQSSTVVSIDTARQVFTVAESIGSGHAGIDFSLAGLPSYGYRYGQIEWVSGLNTGISQELKFAVSATATFTLYLSAPFTIQAGDAFNVQAGCDKRFATCQFFNRQDYYRGFPDIPGQDRYLNYPDARA